MPGACHQRFRTEQQAKAFIDNWKQAVTDVYSREIRKALDAGLVPYDMKFEIESLLCKMDMKVEIADMAEKMNCLDLSNRPSARGP